jgi:hypothetical protein
MALALALCSCILPAILLLLQPLQRRHQDFFLQLLPRPCPESFSILYLSIYPFSLLGPSRFLHPIPKLLLSPVHRAASVMVFLVASLFHPSLTLVKSLFS